MTEKKVTPVSVAPAPGYYLIKLDTVEPSALAINQEPLILASGRVERAGAGNRYAPDTHVLINRFYDVIPAYPIPLRSDATHMLVHEDGLYGELLNADKDSTWFTDAQSYMSERDAGAASDPNLIRLGR